MIYDLSKQPSVLHDTMRELRDVKFHCSKARFRENILKAGQFIGFEISKTLSYKPTQIQTPLARMDQSILEDEVVVVTILRAGLPFHNGLLTVFPEAENGFISAYRKHNDLGFEIESKYLACASLENKVLILNDPMLATGRSFITALKVLELLGKPKRLILAAVIGSEEGVDYLKQSIDTPFDLWLGAIDPELNSEKYIVPGLGDAGDLSFGEKLQN